MLGCVSLVSLSVGSSYFFDWRLCGRCFFLLSRFFCSFLLFSGRSLNFSGGGLALSGSWSLTLSGSGFSSRSLLLGRCLLLSHFLLFLCYVLLTHVYSVMLCKLLKIQFLKFKLIFNNNQTI